MSEREFAVDVVRKLTEAGHQSLWAGGCVRDELLGREPADYDVATAATPEQVQRLFRRTVAVGISFGVVEVLGPKPLKIQVATFRSDGTYSDGRRPDSVIFGGAEEDAKRRDFTINGLFFDPLQNCVIDYVGGQADLDAKLLRAIGNPRDRIAEDKLRMLRAVRLAARFELAIDEATADAIRGMAAEIAVVSPERIAEELRKILVHPRRASALRSMRELGLLEEILPELHDLRFHFEASISRLDALRTTEFPTAFALLFDFMEPAVGAKGRLKHPVGDLCKRLKFSTEERERVEWLVASLKALPGIESRKFSEYQPMIVHPGLEDLLKLASVRGYTQDVQFIAKLLATRTADELNPLPFITGDDLIALEIPAGPRFKEILDGVRNRQLDGEIASRDEALKVIGATPQSKFAIPATDIENPTRPFYSR